MPQDATMLISPGDRQLIEDHGLGLPLVLYSAKEREILNLRIICLGCHHSLSSWVECTHPSCNHQLAKDPCAHC